MKKIGKTERENMQTNRKHAWRNKVKKDETFTKSNGRFQNQPQLFLEASPKMRVLTKCTCTWCPTLVLVFRFYEGYGTFWLVFFFISLQILLWVCDSYSLLFFLLWTFSKVRNNFEIQKYFWNPRTFCKCWTFLNCLEWFPNFMNSFKKSFFKSCEHFVIWEHIFS